jgi:pimeloyl-ACP methyl ester carboxylesterase
MQEKEITLKQKKIFYRSIGEGPVVVLLHGVPFDGTLWRNQFTAFPGFKLIIPDLPGSGRSQMIDDMTIEGMAECVKDIIVHETASLFFKSGEPHSVILIGHSMGGYIALALAQKHPGLLNGLGLFHSSAYADSEEKKEGRKKTIQLLKEKGASEFAKNSVPNLFGPVFKEQNPALVEAQISYSCNFSAETLVKYQETMSQRKDRTEVLRTATVPVLFILGKYDAVVPLKDGMEQCSLADVNYIHVLENSGHVGMMEEPIETNTVLLNYLTNTCRYAPGNAYT